MGVRIEHKIVNGIEEKHCCKCKKWHSVVLFSKDKCTWDRLQVWCKDCTKAHRVSNQAQIRLQKKQWYACNSQKVRAYGKAYYESHKQKEWERAKARRLASPEKIRNAQRRFRKKNPEKVKEYNQRWKEKNPEAYSKSRRASENKRLATLKGKLCKNISRGLARTLRNGKQGKHWESILGYTYKQLKQRLTKTMPAGYEWDDYMNGKLHVDHKIPILVFNFDKIEDTDFKKCWALRNLQLLPALENISKGAKLTKHFQPSFIFK